MLWKILVASALGILVGSAIRISTERLIDRSTSRPFAWTPETNYGGDGSSLGTLPSQRSTWMNRSK